jgi:hypothetical protein
MTIVDAAIVLFLFGSVVFRESYALIESRC